MSLKDIITMSGKELRRLKVIERAIEKDLRQREAASILNLSERQIRRIVKRVRTEGERGIIHLLRSKASNRRISTRVKKKVIRRYREKYIGFGPTLAQEKLLEGEGIRISKETLRK